MQKGQKLLVRDVFDIDRSLAVVVPQSTPFFDVVKQFATRAELRGIFVVDGDKHLTGVITRQDLLHWAANHLGIPDPENESWHDLYRVATANTAQDACRPRSDACSVQLDDPLENVFREMFDNELIDIPVVDDEGHIIGDIRLTEILAKVFQKLS